MIPIFTIPMYPKKCTLSSPPELVAVKKIRSIVIYLVPSPFIERNPCRKNENPKKGIMSSVFKSILVTIALTSLTLDTVSAFSCTTRPTTTRRTANGVPSVAAVRSDSTEPELLSSTPNTSDPLQRRRDVFSSLVTKSIWGTGVLTILSGSIRSPWTTMPAWADVSDGNALPEGAAQFGRIIRAKADLLVRV